MAFQGERGQGGLGMCFNVESMARDGFFITTLLIAISGGAHPHILSMDFADKQTRSRTIAARSHLSATRSGRLLLAQRTARPEAWTPNQRFTPCGYGRRGRRTLPNFGHNWGMSGQRWSGTKIISRRCKLDWTRHSGARTSFRKSMCARSHNN